MNPYGSEMEWLGFDTGEKNRAFRTSSKLRVFDRPDIDTRVFFQFINDFVKEMKRISKRNYRKRFMATTRKQ